MIKSSRFKVLFPSTDGVIGYVQGKGDTSDQFIEMATLSLLRKWKIPFEVISRERLLSDKLLPRRISCLYIAGGGEMGSFYAQSQEVRKQALLTGLPVTVLPQSFTDADENVDAYAAIWVRENDSHAVCATARLAPDMALSARLAARRSEISRNTGVYLRQDSEALFPEHDSSFGDPVVLGSNVAAYLDLIAPYKHIVTDRLNFAIAAMLMQRRVTLLPNAYYKNRSMWETWLADLGCHWADDPDQLKVCRQQIVERKIPQSDDLRISAKDRIHVQSGWRATRQDATEGICYRDRHHPFVDLRQQQLWRMLETGVTYQSLLDRYESGMGGRARDARFDLNQRLRIFFSQGAIMVCSGRRSQVDAGLKRKGGDSQALLEIHPYKPVRMNREITIFADITSEGKRQTAWYRVDSEYRDFLHYSADPFVLSFLQLAMRKHAAVWVREGGVSSGLLRNLQQFQRVWTLWSDDYSEVEFKVESVKAPKPAEPSLEKCAIVSFSGGVDSTFSLYNHTRNPNNHYKHDVRYAMLGHGFDMPVEDQASFQSVFQQCDRVAKEAGIKLMTIASNIRQFDFDWEQGHVSVIASCMHLLSNGFHTGLVPSTLNYGVVYPWGSTPMTDCMHSSDTMRIETDGADYTRVDKIRMLNDWKTGIESLRFCWVAQPYDHNCGRCGKCTMTAIMLLLTRSSKNSIRPFPYGKRLSAQLDLFGFSRLDRSDFRNDIDALKQQKHKPEWLKKFLRKLEQSD